MRSDSSLGSHDLTSRCFSLSGEQLFPAILDALEEPLFLLDDMARLVWHNKACNDLCLAAAGRPIDHRFDLDELLTPEQRGLFLERFDKVMEGERVHFEWKYRRQAIKWLSVSLYPFHAGDGGFTGVCGSLRDITEKKMDELVWLRNTEVLNNIREGVLLVDTDYTILTFNRRATQLFERLDRGLLLTTGISFTELVPEHRRAVVLQHLASVCRGARVEYEVKHPSGLWLFLNYIPIKDEEGNIRQISITFRDDTERKKAEERIREKELKYRALVNSMSEGVILQTTDNRVLAVNRSAAAITGLEVDVLKEKGFPHPSWVLVDERENVISHEGLFYRRNGRIHTARNKIIGIRRTGGIQWLKLNAAVVAQPQPQESCALVVIVTDISEEVKMRIERKRLEEEQLQHEVEQQKKITRVILQTRELERNELGRELHDNINQILAATRLQLSYCLQNFEDCGPVLHQCRQNVIEAMEEIRRLSHKMVMPRFAERSLIQVLKGLVDNYRYAYGISLDIGAWDDDLADVRVTEAIYRIVQEQLSNIYKHAKARMVIIRMKSDGNNALLTVEDDGIGFHTTEKKDGIGISNIHCRAESCGGVAEFISAPGVGCVLFVRLPLKGSVSPG